MAILCGGLGTRLLPVTSAIPKALAEVNGEPFVFHQLRLLRSRGFERIVLCTGYLGEMIEDAVGTGAEFGMTVLYSSDGPQRLGTAGAIRKALPLLGDPFFVTYGDSYLNCDYAAIWGTFRESHKLGLMTVFKNDDVAASGNVEFDNGMILRYGKTMPTPAMGHIDYGVSIFRSSAFAGLQPSEMADLEGVFQQLLRSGELAAFDIPERFYEIGSPSALAETAAFIAHHSQGAR
ncbi:MAG: nucleotidyltransferase family protein [Vulcanimicrobiaceae bacterium]